jgi:carbamoyl-phosphate synthase large subunit
MSYGIINALKASSYSCKIIGIDIYDTAPGIYFCDMFFKGPRAEDGGYLKFLENLIVENNINLVFLGMEEEINIVLHNRNFFHSVKVQFVLNTKELIEISNDKWFLHQKLIEYSLTAIPSFVNGDFYQLKDSLGIPMLAKPRHSYGSKDVVQIYDHEDFLYYQKKHEDNFIFQKIIGTKYDEYTSAVFGLGNGDFVNIINMRRELNGCGTTHKAFVIEDEKLDEFVTLLTKYFKPMGPTNYQFRKENDIYYLLEINARISSSTSIRTAFGYNEAEMCIDYFLLKKKPRAYTLKKGYAMRYYSDMIIYENSDNI